MGFIDKTAKAIRLLISRRYTHNTLTDSQEAFASTFDIGVGDFKLPQINAGTNTNNEGFYEYCYKLNIDNC